MEIKYEPVFGPQELFDGVPEYIEVIRFNDYSRDYLWSDLDKIKHLTFRDLKAIPIVAMRRIIKTPVWTKADQLAGKLPEVGAELLHESEGYVNFVGEFDFRWMLRTKEGGLYLAEKFYCSPIETPEEKAARLEDEWVDAAYGNTRVFACATKDENDRLKQHLRAIYKAQISGDLPVPVAPEQNK